MSAARSIVVAVAAACTALAGCGASDAGGPDGCQVSLAYMPSFPIAGDTIRVAGIVTQAPGVLTYHWSVRKGGASVGYTDAQSDHSEILFDALDPGTYDVTLDVSASTNTLCPQGAAKINVAPDNNNFVNARLHVTPPITTPAPLVDRALRFPAGADYDLGPVVLDPGIVVNGTVRDASSIGVPAYLRFVPQGMSGAVVETFAGANGAFSVRLANQPHDVLVVPAVAGLAPRKVGSFDPSTQTQIAVTTGSAIAGIVHQGATPIAGAKVQLMIGDVPTTLATTAADGTFTVRGVPIAGVDVKVEVTPVATSGVPRLEALGALDLAGSVNINYTALTLRNLVGVQVRRGATAQPNKKVIVVGTVAAVGTVTAGAAATATGFVRIAATTDGAGNLPALLAPAAPLDAVTTVAPGDLAIGALDLTSSVPATISAPAMTAVSTLATDGVDPLDGATLDLVPTRTLALAGAPTLHLTANAIGVVATSLPVGSSYDVRWSDPAARRAPLTALDVTTLAATYALPPALYLSGSLTVTGSSNPVVGASVQILCSTCSGIERSRPIAEAASDAHGDFTIAIPDPSSM